MSAAGLAAASLLCDPSALGSLGTHRVPLLVCAVAEACLATPDAALRMAAPWLLADAGSAGVFGAAAADVVATLPAPDATVRARGVVPFTMRLGGL